MNRARLILAGPAAALLLAGCTQWGIFEDVGSDPHPPELRVISLRAVPPEPPPPPPPPEPEPPPEPPPPEPPPPGPRERALFFESGGFTIRVGEGLAIDKEYVDAGADVVSIMLRDRDGGLAVEFKYAPEEIDTDGDGEPDQPVGAPEFYPGVRGRTVNEPVTIEVPQIGPHRFEMWAVDSHESRSEKVEFVVTVTY